MSLLETMSFGQVPVVTPVGSIPTVVQDKVNGIIISIKNAEDIVDAVKGLTTNKDLCSELSMKAKETIIEKFNDNEYIKQLNELYESPVAN